MTPTVVAPLSSPIVYPESDGLPMADNTLQLRWIVILFGNLAALFRKQQDVFVGANLLWYVQEGRNDLCKAPNVLVVFGRPKGYRGSYKQWEEENVPLTVVFEILSPSNTSEETLDKFAFYEEHGVEEYYLYNPDNNRLRVYLRRGESLVHQRKVNGFASPRLGIRFDLSGPEMVVHYPDGQPFLSFEDIREEYERERQLRTDAEQRADRVERRMKRLAILSRKARLQQATPEELSELERLEEEASA